jgi:hypothetical protein
MKVKIGTWPKNSNRRKIDIRIDHYDTWNCDSTLAHIIYPMLLQLRDTKHGIPNEFVEVGGSDYDVQDSFDFYKETHNDSFDEGCNRWDEVLNKMIWSFEQLTKVDYTEQYHHGKLENEWVELDETWPDPVTGKLEKLYKITELNPGERWTDHAGLALHEERIQEGLNLFGKHFRSLWD